MRVVGGSTVARSGYIWRMPWVCGYCEAIKCTPDSMVEAMEVIAAFEADRAGGERVDGGRDACGGQAVAAGGPVSGAAEAVATQRVGADDEDVGVNLAGRHQDSGSGGSR
jgi:hypothetical protein